MFHLVTKDEAEVLSAWNDREWLLLSPDALTLHGDYLVNIFTDGHKSYIAVVYEDASAYYDEKRRRFMKEELERFNTFAKNRFYRHGLYVSREHLLLTGLTFMAGKSTIYRDSAFAAIKQLTHNPVADRRREKRRKGNAERKRRERERLKATGTPTDQDVHWATWKALEEIRSNPETRAFARDLLVRSIDILESHGFNRERIRNRRLKMSITNSNK